MVMAVMVANKYDQRDPLSSLFAIVVMVGINRIDALTWLDLIATF